MVFVANFEGEFACTIGEHKNCTFLVQLTIRSKGEQPELVVKVDRAMLLWPWIQNLVLPKQDGDRLLEGRFIFVKEFQAAFGNP